jgi:predicted house-cleaning noncanonical NTP pyrophosphatase (MazG superfamily)
MKLNPRFLMEEFAKDKTPKQLIAEGKASKNTVYKYWKRYELFNQLKNKLWELVVESI